MTVSVLLAECAWMLTVILIAPWLLLCVRCILSQAYMVHHSCAGTVTHMAPELIENGDVSTKCDVYAFGILMWELYTRLTPYKGLGPPQILMGVVSSKLRPAFASTTPQAYVVRNSPT